MLKWDNELDRSDPVVNRWNQNKEHFLYLCEDVWYINFTSVWKMKR